VPAILESSVGGQTKVSLDQFSASYKPADLHVMLSLKYIALQILEKLIQTRWKALPVDQQQGMSGSRSRDLQKPNHSL
jgi:hypothetical protein